MSDLRVRPALYDLLICLKVAMFYLATLAVAGGTFMFTTFWIYHYLDLEHEFKDMTELETVAAQSAQGGLRGL